MNLRAAAYVGAYFVVLAGSPATAAESATDVSPICTTVFSEAGPRTLLSRGSHCFRSNVMDFASNNPERTNPTKADVEAYMYSDNALNQLSWDIKLRFRTNPREGEWVPLQLKPYIECGSKCTATSAPTIDLVPGGLTNEVTITLTPMMEGNNLVEFQPFFEYRIVRTGESLEDGQSMANFPSGTYSHVPKIRCDIGLARRGTKGCVYLEAPAIFSGISMSDPDVDESAIHIREAQATTGIPGKFVGAGDGSILDGSDAKPLTRTRSQTRIKENRDEARKRYVEQYAEEPVCDLTTDPDDAPGPCNCDEYPFASTNEGASQGPFSVKRIDAKDNQRAGARLGNFFTSQRVIQDDKFFVNITD
ncbi:NucA/NucB deoxyribonuclease domain-containing protein [Trinickia sp. NRRL B-1857]|uniref:NucA/NucB deoxyribonuclease domain-containing protein n=1 Tax=Trinickia sp. NRRL B-1857 TaxID=3162879 RepID=UPI003D2B5EA0